MSTRGTRRTALALAAAVTACLAACSTGGGDHVVVPADGERGPGSSERPVDPGWQRVDVPGEVRAMDATYSSRLGVAGVQPDGSPLAAAVKADLVNLVASRVPTAYGEGLHGITGDIENDGLVELSDPTDGVPARLLMGWIGDDKWNEDPSAPAYPELEEWHTSTLRDDQGRSAVWASLLYDDEGDIRAVGVVPVGDRWRLRAWEEGQKGWHLTDGGRPLFLDSEPTQASVLTSTEEVLVSVAGVIGQGSDDPEPSVWQLVSEPWGTHEWTRVPLRGGADKVTDLHAWAIGTWVAGTRNGRPVVWDWSEGRGRQVRLPDVRLDPEDPTLKILHGPVGWPLTIAVQSADGPSLWIRDDGEWREVVAPPGSLTLAEGSTYGPYLLIDGELWFWPMPWEKWRQE